MTATPALATRSASGASISRRARRIHTALTIAGSRGLSRTQIRADVFHSNDTPGARISLALEELRAAGLAWMRKEPTLGRSREIWRASTPGQRPGT